jgi:hypothetical protein
MDKEKEGFVTLPGLGLEKEIIDLLNDGKLIFYLRSII